VRTERERSERSAFFIDVFAARVPAVSEANEETRAGKRSVDGERIQEDGTFVFEDGSEA